MGQEPETEAGEARQQAAHESELEEHPQDQYECTLETKVDMKEPAQVQEGAPPAEDAICHTPASKEEPDTTSTKEPAKSPGCRLLLLLKKQYFLVMMVVLIALAAAAPFIGKKQGPLRPEITVKYIAVPLIFLLSGLTLKSRELLNAFVYCKINLLIQLFNLAFIPVLMFAVASLLRLVLTGSAAALVDGLIIMACVPTTVSMCNILTDSARGNVAISLINAALGNLLGVIVTPALILLFIGARSNVDILKVVQGLALTLILPLVVGQILHHVFGMRLVKFVKRFSKTINTWILLLIVYTTFCETFARDNSDIPVGSFFVVLIITLLSYVCFLGCSRLVFAMSCLRISRADQISSWFCSTQKTVATGVPLINIIFDGHPAIGLISVPLLIYHPTQLIVGTLLLGKMHSYLDNEPECTNKSEVVPEMDETANQPLVRGVADNDPSTKPLSTDTEEGDASQALVKPSAARDD